MRRVALLSLLFVALSAPAASAGWQLPEAIAPSAINYPDGAIDDLGFADVTWNAGAKVAVRKPGGRFGAVQTLGSGFGIRVAAVPGGGALAVFCDGRDLYVAHRAAGEATYGPRAKLASNAGLPAIAVDGDGTATIVWTDMTATGQPPGAKYHVLTRTADGTLGEPQELTLDGDDSVPFPGWSPTPIVNNDGAAVLGGYYRSAGSPQFEQMNVPTGFRRATIDGDGNVYLYRATASGNINQPATLRWRMRQPDGNLLAEQELPFKGRVYFDVAMDDSGRAIWTWAETRADGFGDVVYAERAPGGTFEAPVRLTTSQSTGLAYLAMSRSGAASIVWNDITSRAAYTGVGRGVSRGPGKAFGPPQPFSERGLGGDLRLSVNSVGGAVVAYEQMCEARAGRTFVHGAIFEAVGPTTRVPQCEDIPLPDDPPPVVQDVTPPILSFRGSSVVRLKRPTLTVTASCSEPCVLTASGSVRTTGAARTLKLKGTRTKLIPARKAVKLRLRLSKRAYRTVRQALKRKRGVKAVIKVTARDRSGVAKTVRRKLRLKRGR